jgi:GT2 family glycosyltransferase
MRVGKDVTAPSVRRRKERRVSPGPPAGLGYADAVRIAEVVVVHHRTPELLERAVTRLARHAPSVPVRVLDTAPAPDGGRAWARRHPAVRRRTVPNTSYASSVNAALRDAAGPLVAVMNADVMVEADTLAALAAPFHDPSVAATGPLVRTPRGRLQDQGPAHRLRAGGLRGRGPHATRDVPWLSGCLLALRRAAVADVGGFDASLRFFNEDLEWGLRARTRGWRLVLVGAEVEHVGGASTPSAARFWVEGLRGGMVVARRHHPAWQRLAQRAAVGGYAALRARTGPPSRRDAWAAVARMMRRGAFDDPPFGETLDVAAPGFPHAWPPQRR